MNLAWYGHLKFRNQALWLVILASWGLGVFRVLLPCAGESHRLL
ncbi:MAG: DMT family protein [Chthoniobacterales bacterium]